MPWQTPDYYAQEAELLHPDEFRRIHKNQWVDPVEKAIPIEWWDECSAIVRDGEELPALDANTPVVLAIDASVSRDSSSAVIVSRHPYRQKEPAIRQVRVWEPPRGGKLNLRDTVWKYVVEARSKYHIIELTYDEYQMALMATDARTELGMHTHEFGQTHDRAVADSNFEKRVVQKEITHNGSVELRKHVDNAAAKKVGQNGVRFVKMDDGKKRSGQSAKPIDALIASSMGTERCAYLNMAW
jgi:phage terminase large subunit-like protein